MSRTATTTTKTTTAKTFTILPGFGEGRWHTSRLARALKALGYKEAAQGGAADVVITHSAGCFYVPDITDQQQLILINPPYWPDKSTTLSTLQKFWWDFKTAVLRGSLPFLARKTIWNWVYILTGIGKVIDIARTAPVHNFHEALANKHVSVIRNDHDSYLMPDAESTLPPREQFSFYHLPGEHDDCWYTTKDHAELIDRIIQRP